MLPLLDTMISWLLPATKVVSGGVGGRDGGEGDEGGEGGVGGEGGSVGGEGGEGGGMTRGPQSVQSVPMLQSLYCEPGPPSSHHPSVEYWHVSLQPAEGGTPPPPP